MRIHTIIIIAPGQWTMNFSTASKISVWLILIVVEACTGLPKYVQLDEQINKGNITHNLISEIEQGWLKNPGLAEWQALKLKVALAKEGAIPATCHELRRLEKNILNSCPCFV